MVPVLSSWVQGSVPVARYLRVELVMVCWLVGVCHVALIEVDDRGVREGGAGREGGEIFLLMVTLSELGVPMV